MSPDNKLTVVNFPNNSLADVPQKVRDLADLIEEKHFGEAEACLVVLETELQFVLCSAKIGAAVLEQDGGRMKVDWKPFEKDNQKTWPVDKSVIWVTDGERISLARADNQAETAREWIWFDPYGNSGYDLVSDVDIHNATNWAYADLPELPMTITG